MTKEKKGNGSISTTHLFFSFLSLFLVAPLYAFDTGHHYDISRNVMLDLGFSDTAIEITQVQNWLTDYISQDLINENKGELGLLHFDNQFSTENVS